MIMYKKNLVYVLMTLMMYSSILSAMDCKNGLANHSGSNTEQVLCHDNNVADHEDSNTGCFHCDYFGCNTLNSVFSETIKLQFLASNDLVNITINPYPNIPQSTIFHPPKF